MSKVFSTFFGGSSAPAPKPVVPPTDTQATQRQADTNRRRQVGAQLGRSTDLSQFRQGSVLGEMYASGKQTLGAG